MKLNIWGPEFGFKSCPGDSNAQPELGTKIVDQWFLYINLS